MRKLLDKLRTGLTVAVGKAAAYLEDTGTPVSDDPLMDSEPSTPAWQTEIIEHPQYWVESHYVEAAEGAVQGKVTDVMRTVHRDAVKLMFDCIKIQLASAVGPEEGAWRAWVKKDRMHAEITMKYPHVLDRVKTACGTAAENIRTHGIKFDQFPLSVNEKARQAKIDIPINNVELNIEAPLVWMVLHRNRANPIMWGGKLWLPK